MNEKNQFKKLLILPIEVKKREYLAKLYLGLLAAKAGYQVVLGSHDDSTLTCLRNGIYLYKDHSKVSESRLIKLKHSNHKIFSLDEEGLIYISENAYISHRVSKKWSNNIETFFCWGNFQERLIKRALPLANCTTVGNPRIDLLHYVKKNRDKKCPSSVINVLVNTRFASINSGSGKEEFLDRLEFLGVIKSDSDRKQYENYQKNDEIIFNEFIHILKRIANNACFNVVLRPHPAESSNIYKEKLKGYNVVINDSEELVRQLNWADVVVHDGCTTAIEGSLTGALVIGLRPKAVEYSYGEFANAFSHASFQAHDELFIFLNELKLKGLSTYIRKQVDRVSFLGVEASVHELIDCWDAPSSAKKILKSIMSIEVTSQKIVSKKIDIRNKIKKVFYNTVKKYRLVRIFSQFSRVARFINDRDISASKFLPFTLSEIEKDISYLVSLIDEKNLKVKIKLLSDRSFLIYCG